MLSSCGMILSIGWLGCRRAIGSIETSLNASVLYMGDWGAKSVVAQKKGQELGIANCAQ